MADQQKSVGFCGLGAMGFGMAAYLVKQGYTVRGFDVSEQNLARFAAAGGVAVKSLRESAEHQYYYIVMVANMQQAQNVIFDGADPLAKILPHGATLLLCSTVPSVYAQSVAKELEKGFGRGDIFFVDAPVSGGAKRSAAGTLSIMAGAKPAAIEKGRHLLAEMSDTNKLYVVDGGVGQGSNMKMAHQVLAAIHILATSEAFGFAARLGLDLGQVMKTVVDSPAWSWMFENRSERIVRSAWTPPVSALTIILKDTSIITSSAQLFGFPVPLCSIAEQTYLNALDRGWGAEDDGGMVRWYCSGTAPGKTQSSEEQSRLTQLVVAMLEAIHICAAAEAIAFAKHIKIPLAQFSELVNNAAGSSQMFREGFEALNPEESKSGGSSKHSIGQLVASLRNVLAEAQTIRCPLPLASGAMNLLLFAQQQLGDDEHGIKIVASWR